MDVSITRVVRINLIACDRIERATIISLSCKVDQWLLKLGKILWWITSSAAAAAEMVRDAVVTSTLTMHSNFIESSVMRDTSAGLFSQETIYSSWGITSPVDLNQKHLGVNNSSVKSPWISLCRSLCASFMQLHAHQVASASCTWITIASSVSRGSEVKWKENRVKVDTDMWTSVYSEITCIEMERPVILSIVVIVQTWFW